MVRSLARLRALLAAGVLACVCGCMSPTLPLPPPTLPSITIGAEPNTFHLRSERGALPNALIIVVNGNLSLSPHERVAGTIADEDGSWELDIRGFPGDLIDISQEEGTVRSPTTTTRLK